jgi:hypothetical protein
VLPPLPLYTREAERELALLLYSEDAGRTLLRNIDIHLQNFTFFNAGDGNLQIFSSSEIRALKRMFAMKLHGL